MIYGDGTFNCLVKEHLLRQSQQRFNDIEELKAYVKEMNPIEKYLKKLYIEGDTNKRYWDNALHENEAGMFIYPETDINVTISKHFRYDIHYPHIHNFFQMNYIYSGSGKIIIDNSDIRLDCGDICLLSPGTRHYLSIFSDDCIVLKIYMKTSTFEKVFFKWLVENNPLSDFFRRVLYQNTVDNYILFHSAGDEAIRNCICNLFIEWYNHKEYYNIINECILTEIFCRLVREHIDYAYLGPNDPQGVNIGGILKRIRQNYKDVTLDSLSKELGYTKNYICKILKENTGRTFKEILNDIRIGIACSMLSGTEISVREIGLNAGFNSNEHFHRVFKNIKGMSPIGYRNSYVENK